jgi:coenzyme F420-reducing hydrogenase alpha subunit
MEDDLPLTLNRIGLDQGEETVRQAGETVIRNYDPCISCATHLLRLNLNR